MKQTKIYLLMILLATLPGISLSQNFSKVIEIVGGMEESLKGLIAKEEQTRKNEIAALRSDITTLKTVLFNEDTVRQENIMIASADAQSVLERLEFLENKISGSSQTSDIASLAGQLDQLVDELKKVVEEGKQVQQKQLALAPPPLYTITGQIRHRGEIDGRTFVPEARALGNNLLRSRINVSIAPSADTKIFLQVQDSRVFGAGNPALNRGVQDGMSKSIDFHQAYFTVQNLFGMPLKINLGRQEMSFGKMRLISAAGWNNVGNTYDGISGQWNAGAVMVDAFATRLVGTQTSTNAENLRGVYGLVKYSDAHTVDLFLFHDNNTTPILKGVDKGNSRLSRYSLGVTFSGKPKPFDYDAEAIFQRGSIALTDSAALSDIQAHLLAVNAGYTVDAEKKLRFGVKYQIMSGDRDQKSGAYSTYYTMFGAGHAFLGYMDYFPKTFTEYGVHGLSLHSSMEVMPSLSATADFYYYRLDVDGSFKTSSGTIVKERELGFESDFTVTHKYSSTISINAGVSAYLPDGAMRIVKGSSISYWSYIMTTVTF